MVNKQFADNCNHTTTNQYSLSTVCFSATSLLGAASMIVKRHAKAKSRSISGSLQDTRRFCSWYFS